MQVPHVAKGRQTRDTTKTGHFWTRDTTKTGIIWVSQARQFCGCQTRRRVSSAPSTKKNNVYIYYFIIIVRKVHVSFLVLEKRVQPFTILILEVVKS